MVFSCDSKCRAILENKRYILAFLACIGLILPLGMRCELGISIIKMTQYQNKSTILNNSKIYIRVREVAWSNTKVSMIEASFFIGYTLFSIPGGFLASVIPPNLVFGFAVLISSVFNIIIPSLVHHTTGFTSVFIVRIIQGMAEGCLYPSVHSFWRYWAPKQERSKLVTITFFGMALGPIIGYPISGILTTNYGWHSNFYFWGLLSLTWSLLWLCLSRKSPSNDKWITKSEKTYIEENTTQCIVTAKDIPWSAILTSLPVWAIIIANIGRNWTFQFSFSGLPTFFKKKFDESSIDIGLSMSSPYLLMAILTPLGGIVADCQIKKGVSVSLVRKVFNTFGYGIAAICFVIVGFIPYLWLTIIFLTIGLGTTGIGMSGYAVNHLDIADIYAGVLMGISNGLGTMAGVVSPIVAMELTKSYKTTYGWEIFFVLSGLIHVLTVLFYALFASGQRQPWADLTYTSLEPTGSESDAQTEN